MLKNKKELYFKVFSVLMMMLFMITPTKADGADTGLAMFKKNIYGDFSGSVDFINDKDSETIFIESGMEIYECVFNNNKTYYLDDYSVESRVFGTSNILEDNTYGTLDFDMESEICDVKGIIVLLDVVDNGVTDKHFELQVTFMGDIHRPYRGSHLKSNWLELLSSMVSNGSIYIIIIGFIGIIISIIVAIRLSKVKNNALSDDDNKIEKTNRKKRQKKKE